MAHPEHPVWSAMMPFQHQPLLGDTQQCEISVTFLSRVWIYVYHSFPVDQKADYRIIHET